MTQQREFRPNKLCNIPTLTIWISRIYLTSPVNSISLCLRKHTCNYHPYTCLDTTFALTKICLLCVKTNYKFLFPFKTMNVFKLYWCLLIVFLRHQNKVCASSQKKCKWLAVFQDLNLVNPIPTSGNRVNRSFVMNETNVYKIL